METLIKSLAIIALVYLVVLTLYFVFQRNLIFYPQKLNPGYQFNFPHLQEELFLETKDGNKLNALFFKAPRARGCMIYLHGNAGSLAGWGYVAESLINFQHDILMLDYRGYGKSTGKITQQALFQDAQLAYDYLIKRYNENQIVIYGRSIGTGPATWLAARNNPRMLILESPFFNLSDVAFHHFPIFPHSLILQIPLRSDQFIENVQCKVLIIHGDRDEVVPLSSGKKLADKIPEHQKAIVIIKGGMHNNLDSYPQYRQALQEHLGID